MRGRVFLSAVIWACLGTSASSAIPGKGQLESRVDAVVQPYVDVGMFNGIVLIGDGARTTFFKSYGLANYELSVPIKRDTKFQIASITKLFTNRALAVLLDQRKVSLDSKVSDFLPAFPRGSEITVRQIVEERSGIPHTNDLPEYAGRTRMTLWDSVAILSSKPLDFDPGTKSNYSNGAYDVLAAVIERAAGMPFQDWVRKSVLEPYGLKNTGFVSTYAVIPGMADGYVPGSVPGTRARASFYAPEIRPGGGSMYSTADNLLTFLKAIFSGEHADPAKTLMLFGNPQEPTQLIGRNPGYSAVLLEHASEAVFIVTLANNGASLDSFGHRIYQSIAGKPWAVRSMNRQRKAIAPTNAGYYDGLYKWEGRSSSPFRIFVSPAGNLLVHGKTNDYTAAFIPLTGNRWLHPMVDAICEPMGKARAEAFDCVSPVEQPDRKPFKIVRAD